MVSKKVFLVVLILISFSVKASFILLPMDETTQQNHLKAYGITYWAIDKKYKASWLLNYRGGSFLLPQLQAIENELIIRGVSYEIIADGQANEIKRRISSPEVNHLGEFLPYLQPI